MVGIDKKNHKIIHNNKCGFESLRDNRASIKGSNFRS